MKFLPLYDEDFDVLGKDLEAEILNVSVLGLMDDKYLIQKVQDTYFVVVAVEIDGHGQFFTLWKVDQYIEYLNTKNMKPLFNLYRIFICEPLTK